VRQNYTGGYDAVAPAVAHDEEIYTTRYSSITSFSSPFQPGVFGILLSDLGW